VAAAPGVFYLIGRHPRSVFSVFGGQQCAWGIIKFLPGKLFAAQSKHSCRWRCFSRRESNINFIFAFSAFLL